MFIQIEISTHCNFTCFYCAGRDMRQRHMTAGTFEAVLKMLPRGDHVVCLQGEGEPTVHPEFWSMAARIREHGWTPFTITNGSHIDAAKAASLLPRLAVSLDTIDPAEAERIGRKKLPKVLANLDRLLHHMGPQRITIMTVDYGQPLADLARYVRDRGITDHLVQPLQIKEDYRYRYPERPAPSGNYTYRCRYLEQPLHLTFDLDGRRFPCCYIKNPRGYESPEQLRALFSRREVPECCRGCREILSGAAQPVLLDGASGMAPQVSIVVSVKGRLEHLRQSLPALLAQPYAEVIVVDYDCPDGTADWLEREHPRVRTVRVTDAPIFSAARARNIGAAAARGRWLAFLDADTMVCTDFLSGVQPSLDAGHIVLPPPDTPGLGGLLICSATDFRALGGYDEIFEGWGCEDDDMRARLQLLGRRSTCVDPRQAFELPHSDELRLRFFDCKDKWRSGRINGTYVQIKIDLMQQLGVSRVSPEVCRNLYEEIRRTISAQPDQACQITVDLPLETVFTRPPNWRLRRAWTYRVEPMQNEGEAVRAPSPQVKQEGVAQ